MNFRRTQLSPTTTSYNDDVHEFLYSSWECDVETWYLLTDLIHFQGYINIAEVQSTDQRLILDIIFLPNTSSLSEEHYAPYFQRAAHSLYTKHILFINVATCLPTLIGQKESISPKPSYSIFRYKTKGRACFSMERKLRYKHRSSKVCQC